MKRKCLAIGIILLFIGVAVAPSINFTVVKASDDDDLVEVTSQACGIKGFGNTTVKLTWQQYQNLEQYLVDFRARLNQTTTREEAVPIFKEAIVELNKYGLLGGLSVTQTQNLITGRYQNLQKFLKNLVNRNHIIIDDNENLLCLIAGRTNATYFGGIFLKALWYLHYWIPHPFDDVFLQAIIWPLGTISQYKPFFMIADIIMENAVGWVRTVGVLGVKTWNGTLVGMEPSPYWEPNIAVFGFSGINILLNSDSSNHFYLGYALHIRIEKVG